MNKFKNRIFFIIGPTASGKTWTSIELAKKINGEILNCDAFSFYKNCDILTAKATEEEQQQVKHHMVSFLNVDNTDYNVRMFKKDAEQKIQQILNKNKSVIIVGGSNYFQQSLIFQNLTHQKQFTISDKHKQNIQLYLNQQDLDKVYDELLQAGLDIFFHKNDKRKTLNLAKQIQDKQDCDDFINLDFQSPKYVGAKFLILRNTDKKFCQELIDKRIDDMIFKQNGLKEIWKTLEHCNQSGDQYKGVFQGIGYKEFLEVYQKFPQLENHKEQILQSKEFQKCLDLLRLRTFQLYKEQLKWIQKNMLKYPVIFTNSLIVDFDKQLYQEKGKQIFQDAVDKILAQDIKQIEKKQVKQNDNKFYQCKDCNKVMNGIETWHRHLSSKKHKKITKLKTQDQKKYIKQVIECKVCNKKLGSENQYKLHIQSKRHLKNLNTSE